jgi:hypothetical protein
MADATLADMIAEVQTRLGDDGTFWTEELVRIMLESGLSYLFPKFYAVEPMLLEGNGSTTVFALEPTIGEEVGGVLDIFLVEGQ